MIAAYLAILVTTLTTHLIQMDNALVVAKISANSAQLQINATLVKMVIMYNKFQINVINVTTKTVLNAIIQEFARHVKSDSKIYKY